MPRKTKAGGTRFAAVLALLISTGAQADVAPEAAPLDAETQAKCDKLAKKLSKPGFWASVGAGMAANLANTHYATISGRTTINGSRYYSSSTVRYTDHYGASRDFVALDKMAQKNRKRKLQKKADALGCPTP